MPSDVQYQKLPRPGGELEHAYGPNVHILSQPYPMSLLTRLCSEPCVQPEVNTLVKELFGLDHGSGQVAVGHSLLQAL